MKVVVTEDDRFCHTVYDEQEAMEMFGFSLQNDSEMFIDLPNNIVMEYKEIYKKFWEINKTIRALKKMRDLTD